MLAAVSTAPCARPLAAALPARSRRVQRLVPILSYAKSEHEPVEASSEWELVTSMSSQDDLLLYYNHQHEPKRSRLADVMQTNLITTTPEASLAEVAALLEGPPRIEGLPVVGAGKKLVGVVSNKDLAKGGSTVKDVMSSPPVALKASGKVTDAAKCMVEHRFHRVPVVDDEGVCVGIVTRSDIFFVLSAADQEGASYFQQEGIDV